MEEPLKITKRNPFDKAGLWQRITFTWILPLFNLGWTRDLEHKDLYTCPKEDDPEVLADALER